ncbi:MAG: response regulator transcription factor [Cytophagaceae bacterium]|nr:response regulator transcription factor [Gemmatimonadaceae bacterium]
MSGASMAPWRVVIADDEPLARLRLRGLLTPHAEFTIVGECEDGQQVLDALTRERPDVVFLDVRMPGLDGIEVAQVIAADAEDGRPPPAIVFVTAYDAHAVHAFDLDAIDYLVKPVDLDRFDRAIDRLARRLRARDTQGSGPTTDALRVALATLERLHPGARHPQRFPVRDASGVFFVATSDIEWIDAEGNYVGLWVRGRRHLCRESMRGIEAKLDPERFVRVHRSTIVAIDRIRRIAPHGHGEHLITLVDGTTVTSSRTHSERLQQLMR